MALAARADRGRTARAARPPLPRTTEATVYGVVADAIARPTASRVSVADRGDRLHVELRG
jgi:hypothetical protein